MTTFKKKVESVEPAAQEEEEIDIDLDDPDVGKAAVKIQAGFRGLQARRQVQAAKGSKVCLGVASYASFTRLWELSSSFCCSSGLTVS